MNIDSFRPVRLLGNLRQLTVSAIQLGIHLHKEHPADQDARWAMDYLALLESAIYPIKIGRSIPLGIQILASWQCSINRRNP